MTSLGSRIVIGLAIAALVAPIVLLGAAFTKVVSLASGPVAAPASGRGDNPLVGRSFYTDPASKAAGAAAGTGDPASRALVKKIAAQPTAIWLVPEKYPLATVKADVANIADEAIAENDVPVFVVYGIPNRDCGNHSSGGLSTAEYPEWIAEISAALRTREAVVILEPDALALAAECGNIDERIAEVRGAVEGLKSSKAIVYLDGGHSNWITAPRMAQLLNAAGVADARGFATNVSNYNTTAQERAYGERLSQLTGGARYVIDTGRNGNGSNGEWCNPEGRALGSPPTPVESTGGLDAELWIKPPGESDGPCNGGPAAGEWWNDRAVALADAAGW